jgi:hypothetical protein
LYIFAAMPLSLPHYQLQIRSGEREPEVWDGVRKKWLMLTPEEQVRQCLMIYLAEVCGVPRSLMSLERGLNYDRRRKRYDLLIYDRNGQPFMLCECKEPRVAIDDAVLHQTSTYNSKIGAKVLLMTNGGILRAFGRMKDGKWAALELPDPALEVLENWFDAAMLAFG